MINPKWKREINIAKIRIELMLEKLQQEFNNGNIYSQEGRQPLEIGTEVQNNPAETIEPERVDNIIGGANN